MNGCLDEWFSLANEGSISWRSVADMCAGAYQVLVCRNASPSELNEIALAWDRAVQLHEHSIRTIHDVEFFPNA